MIWHSSCGADSSHQCSGKPTSVANGTLSGGLTTNKWFTASLALTPGATGLKITAVVVRSLPLFHGHAFTHVFDSSFAHVLDSSLVTNLAFRMATR